MQNERKQYIDIAKGIVIALMVLGHSSLPDYPQKWIYSFHMPFFFIISGALTNWDRDIFFIFLRDKSKALLLPFIVYSFIVILLTNWYTDLTILNNVTDVIVHGWGDLALWFVPVLWAALICSKAILIIKKKCFRGLFVTCAFTANFLLINQYGLSSWKIGSIIFALTFVLIGSLLSKFITKIYVQPSNKVSMILLFSSAISFFAPLYVHMDMAHNILNHFIIGYLCAIAGTFLILCESILIERYCSNLKRCFIGLGKNTFVILAFSQIIIMGFNLHFPQLGPLKYLLLIIVMYIFIFIKDAAKRIIY